MTVIGIGMSFPWYLRSKQTETTIGKSGKLSGSQRQRGMYMNGGSSDAGPDLDYDVATGKWTGYQKRAERLASVETRRREGK